MNDRAHERPQGHTTFAASSLTPVKCPVCGARHWDAPTGSVVRTRAITSPRDAAKEADVVRCRRCNPAQYFEVVRTLAKAA